MSLFETRCRLSRLLQLHTTCGHSDRDSRIPRRDGGRNLLPFLTHPLAPLRESECASSRASSAATRCRCWFLRLPGLPNREPPPSAPPSTAFTGEVSDDRRARAPGPSEGRVTERVSSESCRSNGCVALVAHADRTFPSSASKGHPLSPARSLERGEPHSERRRAGQDRRSTAIPRRTTAS